MQTSNPWLAILAQQPRPTALHWLRETFPLRRIHLIGIIMSAIPRPSSFHQLLRMISVKFVSGVGEEEREGQSCCNLCERVCRRTYFGVNNSQLLYYSKTILLFYCAQIRCKSVNPIFSPNRHTRTHFAPCELHLDSHTLQ